MYKSLKLDYESIITDLNP